MTLVAMTQAVTPHDDRALAIDRARDLWPTLDHRQIQLVCSWSEALTADEIDTGAVAACLRGMAETQMADPFARIAPHDGYSPNAAMRTAIIRGSGR